MSNLEYWWVLPLSIFVMFVFWQFVIRMIDLHRENRKPLERDWYQDNLLENGNYMHNCAICNETFMGHKNRYVCKVCAG